MDSTRVPVPEAHGRVSRRTVLRGGVALGMAAAVGRIVAWPARAAAAAPIQPVAGDNAPAIQAAIDAAGAGAVVQLAEGTFPVGSPLQLRSGVTLAGAGSSSTVLIDYSTLGAAPILNVVGTASDLIENVTIQGLTIRNGTATTGTVTVHKDGIVVDYANVVSISDCMITEIQGYYGVRCEHSQQISVTSSTFYRCSYAMLMLLPECDTVTVRQCTFDTLVSTAYANVYMFATGGEQRNYGDYFVRNVWVENNIFRNNPLWIGINTHGGENIYFRNNQVTNTHYGILCSIAQGYVANPVLRHVVIENNTITDAAASSISAVVVDCVSAKQQAEQVTIADNTIDGYAGSLANYGTITVGGITDVTIDGNTLTNFGTYAVSLFDRLFDVEICNNTMHNLGSTGSGGAGKTAAVGALRTGVFGVDVHDNTLTADSSSATADWFVYTIGQGQSWQIADNHISDVVQSPPYANLEYLPVLKDSIPTAYLIQKHGDVVSDSSGAARWKVTVPGDGYGAFDTSTTIVDVQMTAGSEVATIVTGGSENIDWLPPGMNLAVDGAGDGGTTLLATVTSNSGGSTVVLDTAANVTVSAAAVRYQAMRLSSV